LSVILFLKSLNKIEFIKHGKNYLTGNVLTKGLAFLSIPILTRLLSPNDYGQIAVFISMMEIFTLLIGLNFVAAIGRRYYEEDDKFGEYMYSTMLFVAIVGMTIALVFVGFSKFIASYFDAPRVVVYLAIGVAYGTVFVNLYLNYLRANLSSKRFVVVSFIQSVSLLLLSIVCIFMLSENRYLGRLWAQAAIATVFAVFAVKELRSKMRAKWDFAHVRYALVFGIPLIPHMLSYFILASFDRLIINQLKNAAEAGLYSLAYNVGSILMVVVGGLNGAWSPLLFKDLNNGRYDAIQVRSDFYAMFVVFIAFGLALFSREILMVMASPKFYQARHIVPVIVLSSVFIFLYQLCVNYTFYLKRNIWVSINTLAAGALNIVLNYIYIPRYGYAAAAWTTLASYVLLFILNYVAAYYFMREKMMRFGLKMIILGAAIVLTIGVQILEARVESYFLSLFTRVALVFVAAWLLYRRFHRAGKGLTVTPG